MSFRPGFLQPGPRGGGETTPPQRAARGACAVRARCGGGHCACAQRPAHAALLQKFRVAAPGPGTLNSGRRAAAAPQRQPCFPREDRKPALRSAEGGGGRRPSLRSPGQRSQSRVGPRCAPPPGCTAEARFRPRCRSGVGSRRRPAPLSPPPGRPPRAAGHARKQCPSSQPGPRAHRARRPAV